MNCNCYCIVSSPHSKQVGDRVGVLRKADGTLHFYVNAVDQGVAASNVPDTVFGVIDLYGQAAQATIVDPSGLSINLSVFLVGLSSLS